MLAANCIQRYRIKVTTSRSLFANIHYYYLVCGNCLFFQHLPSSLGKVEIKRSIIIVHGQLWPHSALLCTVPCIMVIAHFSWRIKVLRGWTVKPICHQNANEFALEALVGYDSQCKLYLFQHVDIQKALQTQREASQPQRNASSSQSEPQHKPMEYSSQSNT